MWRAAIVVVHLFAVGAGTASAQVQGLPLRPSDYAPLPGGPPPAPVYTGPVYTGPVYTGQPGSVPPPVMSAGPGAPGGFAGPAGPEGFYPPPIQGGPIQGAPVVPSAGPQWPYQEQPTTCAPNPNQGCDNQFRFQTARGGAIIGIPRTLLWEPPLAIKREPRFQAMPTTLSTSVTQSTLDTSIGTTLALVRFEPADQKIMWQFDAFGLVYSRFSNYDVLIDSDYRYGFPITFSCGPWQGKFAYEHTSSHLGDEPLIRDKKVSFDYIRDEIVFGLSRYFCDYRMRLYGQAGWSFNQYIPGDPPPYRFDTGIEWTGRRCTGCWGLPFAALNVTFDGAVNFDPNCTMQLGWQWRDPTRRLGQCRVFGEYYSGYSPYGQFFSNREEWLGIGVAFDY